MDIDNGRRIRNKQTTMGHTDIELDCLRSPSDVGDQGVAWGLEAQAAQSLAERWCGDRAEQWPSALSALALRLESGTVGALVGAAGAPLAKLSARLSSSLVLARDLRDRHSRCASLVRGVEGGAVGGRVHSSRRALLSELQSAFAWLEADELRDADRLPDLRSGEGRAVALCLARALDAALSSEARPLRRLAAANERLRGLSRARDRLASSVSRHVNDVLVHEAAEALSRVAPVGKSSVAMATHHQPLEQFAELVLWLKGVDQRSYDALLKVYAVSFSRVYERQVSAWCSWAKQSEPQAFEQVLAWAEATCDAEQSVCERCLFLGAEASESKRMFEALFPTLENELCAIVQHEEKGDAFGAMRAVAIAGGRALSGAGRWGARAVASCAVSAKRLADAAVRARAEAWRNNARRGVCCASELAEVLLRCEQLFCGVERRSDVERWYAVLGDAAMDAADNAFRPKANRALLRLEMYHALHDALSTVRVSCLENVRRSCRANYLSCLESFARSVGAKPLERLRAFMDRVEEALAEGALPHEVCFRPELSKQELRRVLALHSARDVAKAVARVRRGLERDMGATSGLLRVVWRELQQQLLQQHKLLQELIHKCYGASGLTLPFCEQDLLHAFNEAQN